MLAGVPTLPPLAGCPVCAANGTGRLALAGTALALAGAVCPGPDLLDRRRRGSIPLDPGG
jgi:hypothetical protein